MSCHAFKNEYLKRWIAYFSLLCFLFTSQLPAKLFADPCSCCVLVDEEDARRTKIATVVAGATVIALIGGVVWLASGPSSGHKRHHHHHHHSHSSDSYYDSYYSHSHHHGHHHHHHHHHGHHHHHDSYNYLEGEKFTDPQFLERGDLMPVRSRQLAISKHSQESSQLSGVFTTHASMSASSQGSVTAFVRLPDGTMQVLGTLPFSSSGNASLSYGPFDQKGTYAFGIVLDAGAHLPSQVKIGSVEVNLNGSRVESHDFFIPAHAPGNYEPCPCEYTL